MPDKRSSKPHEISRIRDRRPLQAEIRDAILNEYILSGTIASGHKLPSESQLAASFRASRVTIRTALQTLKDQGYIRIVRGSGSIVLPRADAISSGLDRLVSFDNFALQSGFDIHTQDVEISQVGIEDDLVSVFEMDGPFTRVSRVKSVHGRKVGLIVDYVPESIISFEQISKTFKDSVLDLLLVLDGVVAYSDCTLSPVAAIGDVGAKLDSKPDEALLHLSEMTRNVNGEVSNRSESWLSPEAFRFQLRRRLED